MDREQILSRYQRLRRINIAIKQAAMNHLAETALLRVAKQLGLGRGRTWFCDNENEEQLLFDLALFMPTHAGGLSPVQRYARALRNPDTDTASMLAALLASRLSIWAIKRRHEVAGIVVSNVLNDHEEVWVMDVNLEASVQPGWVFAGRIATADDFAMICTIVAPLREIEFFELLNNDLLNTGSYPFGSDAGCTFAACAAAIRTGVMDFIVTRDPAAATLPFSGPAALEVLA